MQQKERDWDALLYSHLYPHTQTLISPQYVSLEHQKRGLVFGHMSGLRTTGKGKKAKCSLR